MAIKAHLDQPVAGATLRTAPRRALRLDASGFAPGAGEANVTIHNLSAAGLLLETALILAEGEHLALELPEAGTVTAVIVWRSDRLYGCAFAQALSPAALAAAQLRGRPPEAPAPNPSPIPAPIPFGQPTIPAATMLVNETLGTRINRMRREAGLTLADVAAALGVSKPTVWAWEKGKARPLPERLDAIAAALGVAPDALTPSPGAGAGVGGAIGTLIEDCRARIAEACGTAPSAVRILLEL